MAPSIRLPDRFPFTLLVRFRHDNELPRHDVGQEAHQKPNLLDKLANKDDLTVDDVRELQQELPSQPEEESIAWDLAARVQRAPQYCRFLNFEKLNMMNLYILQHKILSLMQSPSDAEASGALQQQGGNSRSSQEPASNTSSSAIPPLSSRRTSAPFPRPSADLQQLLRDYSKYSSTFQDLASLRRITGSDEALKTFKEMQTWPEASSSSCKLARSDFAYLFRDEKYLTVKEKMFDLNPSINARAGNSMDGIRQLLMGHLPLRFVNRDEWNLRLAKSSEPGAQLDRTMTGSSRKGT